MQIGRACAASNRIRTSVDTRPRRGSRVFPSSLALRSRVDGLFILIDTAYIRAIRTGWVQGWSITLINMRSPPHNTVPAHDHLRENKREAFLLQVISHFWRAFHADYDSEYINDQIAKLPEKQIATHYEKLKFLPNAGGTSKTEYEENLTNQTESGLSQLLRFTRLL